MPPALSDEESSDVGEFTTPPRASSRKSTSATAVDQLNDMKPEEAFDQEDGDEDEDLDEDEFVVEAIKKHMVYDDGSLQFQVKWEGYEAKKDLTWEPEENLRESAQEILDAYFEKFGGREKLFEATETASKTKKRRRATTNGTPSTTSTTKRSRREHPANSATPATAKNWSPPAGSWEEEIETIDACEDEGSGKLIVYLIWKNGRKTKHDTDVIYKKCPQKMLRFYERHVKIIRDENKALVDGTEN
ncbi:Chromo domain-containing protein 2 [Fusarium oxysporum f. sp. cubense]|uniref:Chromo domain-containing protein 2 n=1 Tax=Fusarium oxysporum f. sp. cubense TaxID=61366 RepID=A0A559KP56_FUSOC|nr:Chromo domain-containing protein 2 [Fusarium oxysporum f. sp. cubense]